MFKPAVRMALILWVLSLLYVTLLVNSFAPATNGHRRALSRCQAKAEEEQATEALHSLVDFHQDRWKGRARSFTVTPDVAAGIVNKKQSPEYITFVSVGLDQRRRDVTLEETIEWSYGLASRKIYFANSNFDVDAVDASYSLDAALSDWPPAAISGTDKLVQFMMEHCIATNDNERVRCFALYGVDQALIRVVVCHEERIQQAQDLSSTTSSDSTSSWTAQDLLEIQNDVDRLVDRISNSIVAANETMGNIEMRQDRIEVVLQEASSPQSHHSLPLSRHPVKLVEVSSGLWLGDMIVRDYPTVPLSPLEQTSKGFGGSAKSKPVAFGSWSMGVNKVAWRWMWNFGEEIRQVNDIGKGMGAQAAEALAQSLSGCICVNEGLSRRMPRDERMVYIDWGADNVGFLLGSVAIQVPRYLNFESGLNRHVRPIYAEFSVFQSFRQPHRKLEDVADPTNAGIPLEDVVCSKITRVYNYEGRFKQGCTSFFNFQRFGAEQGDGTYA